MSEATVSAAEAPPSQSAAARAAAPQHARTLGNSTAPVRNYVLFLTLLALVLRLTVALVVAKTLSAQWLFSQATELGCMANSILHGEGFSSPFCGHTGPSAFLGPGYPLFVSAVFRLFGPYTMQSAECMVVTQALFSTATVPVTMWVARRAFGTRAANLAGFLCALNPWLVGLEAVLWETSLSILLLTTLLGLAVALMQEPSRGRWYAAAIVLSVAVCVNPSLVVTGVVLLATAFLTGPRLRDASGAKRRRAEWVAPAFLFLVLCTVWPVRNFRVLHAFVPLRSNMGYELWQGNRPGADGFFQATLHPNVNAAEFQRYKTLGEIAYMREKSQLAASWIRTHPQHFAILTAERAVRFWMGIGRTRSVLLILSTTILSLAGVSALLALFRSERKLATLFALPILLLPLPYYISHPDFRFWCLLAPVLTTLCAWWITQRWPNSPDSSQPKAATS